MLFLEG
jgi:hypothetical protein